MCNMPTGEEATECCGKSELISEKLDVVNIASEYDNPEINPGNARLEIADFADSLSLSYRNVCIHFDVAKLDSKELDILVRALTKSFNHISITRQHSQ